MRSPREPGAVVFLAKQFLDKYTGVKGGSRVPKISTENVTEFCTEYTIGFTHKQGGLKHTAFQALDKTEQILLADCVHQARKLIAPAAAPAALTTTDKIEAARLRFFEKPRPQAQVPAGSSTLSVAMKSIASHR